MSNSNEAVVQEIQRLKAIRRTIGFLDGAVDSSPNPMRLARLINILEEPIFTSRRPVIGPVLSLTKTILFRLTRRVLCILLDRQLAFNQKQWNLMMQVDALERRLFELERTLKNR